MSACSHVRISLTADLLLCYLFRFVRRTDVAAGLWRTSSSELSEQGYVVQK